MQLDSKHLRLVIVDYGMGNLKSIQNRLRRLEIPARISSYPGDVLTADKLILPGVGAFDAAMQNLRQLDLLAALYQKVTVEKTPILGICLGMQLFTEWSEEGEAEGLGWIEGHTVKFSLNGNGRVRVPHMGWNSIRKNNDSDFLQNLNGDAMFYFVHSYHVSCEHDEDVLAWTQYGYTFPSIIRKDNILGTQFHPEKSHDEGALILWHFVRDF